MQYKYAKENPDYSDFASGRVFYSLPGHPAFPVRLASEIFQRCMALRETVYNISTPCTLYDPCCGAAYHLGILGYFHPEYIREIIASDVDEKAVSMAKQNLELLNINGLDKRINEISKMIELHGKDSHRDALCSAGVLRKKIQNLSRAGSIKTNVFQANAANVAEISGTIPLGTVDIVFTDVPYGQHSSWQGSSSNKSVDPLWSMLEALCGVLSSSSIVAIVSDKQQKASHKNYQRVEQFQIGKRRAIFFKPVSN